MNASLSLTSCCLTLVFGASLSAHAQITTVANGNVGIGNTAPMAKLDVVNATANTPNTALFHAPHLGPRWSHIHFGQRGDWYIRSAADSGNVILQDFGGRVGIGTASPSGKLHVADWHADVRTSEGASPDGWAKDGLSIMGNPGVGYSSFRVWSGHNPVADRGLVSFDRQGKSYLYVRMDGNVGIGTKAPSARLEVAGNVRCTTLELTSDRKVKRDLQTVDSKQLLERLSTLPITTWSYRTDDAARHIGPMAQDFQAAFGVGTDDKHISVVDGIGVSLAAIQGLHAELQASRTRVVDQEREIARLKSNLNDLQRSLDDRIAALERASR